MRGKREKGLATPENFRARENLSSTAGVIYEHAIYLTSIAGAFVLLTSDF